MEETNEPSIEQAISLLADIREAQKAIAAQLLRVEEVMMQVNEAERDRIRVAIETPSTKKRADTIVAIVGGVCGISPIAIMSRCRTSDVAGARHIVFHCIREVMGLGPVETGRLMDREHASISYGLKVVADRMSVDPDFEMRTSKALDAVRTAVNQK